MPNWLLDARVVPWSSWQEWAEVRRLARGDRTEQERAHAIIACWRLRRGAVMPITLQTDVSLRLLLCTEKRDTYEWRLSVAMALVRLVNGLTDRLQGSRARSVKSLSEQLSLPSALVSVRHAATHNDLPSAKTLNAAAHSALQWIDEKYWQPQAKAANIGPTTLADIRRVFEDDAKLSSAFDSHEFMMYGDTLQHMRDLTTSLANIQASKNSMKKDTKGRKRWRACGNEEEWQRMPLGLCPWQTEVNIDFSSAENVPVPQSAETCDKIIAMSEENKSTVISCKRRRLSTKDLEEAKNMSEQLFAA